MSDDIRKKRKRQPKKSKAEEESHKIQVEEAKVIKNGPKIEKPKKVAEEDKCCSNICSKIIFTSSMLGINKYTWSRLIYYDFHLF